MPPECPATGSRAWVGHREGKRKWELGGGEVEDGGLVGRPAQAGGGTGFWYLCQILNPSPDPIGPT